MSNHHESNIELKNGSFFIFGKLNFLTVMMLWRKSLPLLSQCKELKFDFSGVTQSNSAALALLLEWLKYAKKHHRSISFEQLPAQLKAIAEAAGIAFLLP